MEVVNKKGVDLYHKICVEINKARVGLGEPAYVKINIDQARELIQYFEPLIEFERPFLLHRNDIDLVSAIEKHTVSRIPIKVV